MPDPVVRPGSDAEWEALLRQLPQRALAEPRPFFYGRVRARLLASAGAAPARLPQWLRRPAFAALVGALVLATSGDGPVAATTPPAPRDSYPAPQPR